MKKLLLLLPFLNGCMSKNADGVKTHNIISWMNPFNWGGYAGDSIAAASPFVPYHYGSIGMFMFGVICIAWAKGSTRTGWTLVIGSVALSAWASVMEEVAQYISWFLLSVCVLVAGYLVWKYFSKDDVDTDAPSEVQPT